MFVPIQIRRVPGGALPPLDRGREAYILDLRRLFCAPSRPERAAFGRIQDAGITYYADQTYASKNGRNGFYFRDPNGHLMEIITAAAREQA